MFLVLGTLTNNVSRKLIILAVAEVIFLFTYVQHCTNVCGTAGLDKEVVKLYRNVVIDEYNLF